MVTVLPRKPWQWTPIALTYQTGTGGIVCPCWPWKLKENLGGGGGKHSQTGLNIMYEKEKKKDGKNTARYRKKKNLEPFVSWRRKSWKVTRVLNWEFCLSAEALQSNLVTWKAVFGTIITDVVMGLQVAYDITTQSLSESHQSPLLHHYVDTGGEKDLHLLSFWKHYKRTLNRQ